MHHRTLTCALGVLAITLSSSLLSAHGGMYRGPRDTVPPGGGSSRTPGPGGDVVPPTTGRPTGPSNPNPVGPPTGSPGKPSTGNPTKPGTSGQTGHRGIQITDDLTNWNYWWEFNKDAYIGLRKAIHQTRTTTGLDDHYLGATRQIAQNLLQPTHDQIQNDILPSLKRAIDSTEQRDIVSSCMIGMAKIGADHRDFALVDVFTKRLKRNNQEIQETAALALGIAAVKSEKALDTLVALAVDAPAGRRLVDGRVSVRTRSFALYGLGLYASEHAIPEIKQRAFEAMRSVVESDKRINRNIKVAAIEGIGMLAFDHTDATSRAMLEDALDVLKRYYDKKEGVGSQLIQAHCPTAITKLIGRDHRRSDEFRRSFAAEIRGSKKGRRNHNLARSCVLALGQMCSAHDDKNSEDAVYSKLLVDTFKNHKDAQTRNFALVSLGQIGGVKNRQFLLRIVEKGKKASERPWAALGLGLQTFASHKRLVDSMQTPKPDVLVGETLLEQLGKAKSPQLVGALGIALGLCKFQDASELMQRRILKDYAKVEQTGYLCLGLALMADHRAIQTIRKTMDLSVRRPSLFVQAATALGVLGDKSAAQELHRKLDDEGRNLATLAAIATALGKIGDRGSVAPLKRALFDSERGDLQRAFAAVSLGGVADRALMPWHTKISKNINYRASVETLTNMSSGVLDIL